MIDSESFEPFMAALVDRIAVRLATPALTESLAFGELFALYYERHVKARLKDTQNAHYFFKVHGQHWRDVQVHEIKRRDVQDWVDQIGVKSPSAATRALNMMRAIINWGILRDLLPPITNPCKGVEAFSLVSRDRFLAPKEIIRFKMSLDAEPPLMRDLCWMLLLTGARRANVLAMRWDEIDFELATWTVPADKFKNGNAHLLPLSSSALSILHQRQSMSARSPWVFPGAGETGHLVEPKRAWKRIMERAGISDLHIHDLRRTLASYMAMKGESPYVIARMLGHKDMRSTAVYARLNLDTVRDAVESVTDRWQDLIALPAETVSDNKLIGKPHQIESVKKQPANAAVKIGAAEQILVEARVLISLRSGGGTKKHFHQKIGGKLRINGSELERILQDMEARKLIERFRDDRGNWLFTLCGRHRVAS